MEGGKSKRFTRSCWGNRGKHCHQEQMTRPLKEGGDSEDQRWKGEETKVGGGRGEENVEKNNK